MEIHTGSVTDGTSQLWRRAWPWLLLAAALLFAGGVRLRLLDVPLERDEGEYAYAGQLIAQGVPPYEQAYNMKLPGTYYAYATGMALFGQNIRGVHLTLLAVNSLTCLMIFFLGRSLASPAAGGVAGASYALMSLNPVVLGLAAHATQFVVLFAVPGAWLLWKALESGDRRGHFFSGLLFGLAFLMKQHGFCFGLFGVVVVVGEAVRAKTLRTGVFFQRLGLFAAGLALPFLLFCGCAAIAGDFRRFWFWTFAYAGKYVNEWPLQYGVLLFIKRWSEQLPVFGGFWLLAALGLAMSWRRAANRRAAAFLMIFLACSYLGTAPGIYFRHHYFVLVLPAIAMASGLGFVTLGAALGRRLGWVPAGLLLAAGLASVYPKRAVYFQLSPEEVCVATYGKNPFREAVAVAGVIRDHAAPDAKVAVVGSEPQIYFYAGRQSATGYLYTYPLMETQPFARVMQREMIGEIESARPEFIVLVAYKLSWLGQDASDQTIFREMGAYTRRYYRAVALFWDPAEDDFPSIFGISPKDVSGPLHESMILYQRKAEGS